MSILIVMSNILIFCLFSFVFLSSSSLLRLTAIFSLSTPPNVSHLLTYSGQAPGANTTKSWGLPMTGSPWSFWISDLSTLSLQQFINYSSGFLAWQWVPLGFLLWAFALVNCDSQYLPVTLFNPRGSSLLCVFPSLWFEKSCWFFSLLSFLLVRMATSKLLTCGIENWSWLYIFL